MADTQDITTLSFGIIFFSIYSLWGLLIVILWIVSGFLAFIASIICMFYNSSIGDKMAGLLIALFFGPFYWFFYIYNMNYCNRTIYYQ